MDNRKIILPVNWVDGMKINKDHFIASDRFNASQLHKLQTNILNPYNYGLALQHEENVSPVKILVDIDNQGYVHVRVINCSATTRGGYGIDIREAYFAEEELVAAAPQLKMSRDQAGKKEFFICLAVNHQERVPFGLANPEEVPPRLPFVLPGYHLSVHNTSEKSAILTQDSLIIGRLVIEDGRLTQDESYIPACQTIYSHPRLAEYHSQLVKILGQVEIDVVDILRSIKSKKQTTTIAETVAEVGNALLEFLGVQMVEFRKIARYYAPVFLFEKMSAMARTINNAINKQPPAEREEFYNYIQDWSNLKQGEFEMLLVNAIEFEYDHDDINNSIQRLAPFVYNISQIFHTLSNLDFIGKKKDRQIFVKEQKEKPSSSFLVD